MGNADITRDQFSAAKNVIRKIGQRDVYIVDADFNEQGQVSDYRLTELAYLLAQGKNIRFGSGWAISGGSNQISITAGKALIQLATGQSYILNQPTSPLNVTGWTTPSGGNRTDILYADISLPIIDVGDDATIVNPTVGLETCVDQRLTYTLVKLQGTVGGGVPTIPTPPAGHYYVAICQIARTSGQATINAIDITNLLTPWHPLQEVVIWNHAYVAPVGQNFTIIDDWDDQTKVIGLTNDSTPTYYKKLAVPLYKKPWFNTVIFRAQLRRRTSSSATYNMRLTVNGFTPDVWIMGDDAWTLYERKIRVETAADNADLFVTFEMESQISGAPLMRKGMILVASE